MRINYIFGGIVLAMLGMLVFNLSILASAVTVSYGNNDHSGSMDINIEEEGSLYSEVTLGDGFIQTDLSSSFRDGSLTVSSDTSFVAVEAKNLRANVGVHAVNAYLDATVVADKIDISPEADTIVSALSGDGYVVSGTYQGGNYWSDTNNGIVRDWMSGGTPDKHSHLKTASGVNLWKDLTAIENFQILVDRDMLPAESIAYKGMIMKQLKNFDNWMLPIGPRSRNYEMIISAGDLSYLENAYDGKNQISKREFDPTSTVIATARTGYDSTTGKIRENDIKLNKKWNYEFGNTWFLNDDGTSSIGPNIDGNRIFAHELGHGLGMGDIYYGAGTDFRGSIMTSYKPLPRNLNIANIGFSNGDRAFFNEVYPK